MVEFCDLISQVSVRHAQDGGESEADEEEADEPWFVRQQLFGLAKFLDFGDEAGRRQLTQLLCTLWMRLRSCNTVGEVTLNSRLLDVFLQ